MNRSICFLDKNEDSLEIDKLVKIREPVNIAMRQYFDRKEYKKLFGNSISYYREYFNKYGKLAPNIGIYNKTPVKISDDNIIDNVHIYHAIAPLLDNIEQPDYKYIVEGKNFDMIDEMYRKVFNKIFACAAEMKLNTIVLSFLGLDEYSLKLYPDLLKSFAPNLNSVYELYKKSGKNFKILFMGNLYFDFDQNIELLSNCKISRKNYAKDINTDLKDNYLGCNYGIN